MDEPKILKLAVFLVFLVVQPRTNGQWIPRPIPPPIAPRPLCASQFALASHACAFLPYVPSPSPSPPPPSLIERHDSLKHQLSHDRKHEHEHEHEHQHEHEQEHEHEHEHEHKDGHRHEHRHRRHGHTMTPVEASCCHWLGTIDSECVCDLLVYLPPFLSRPVHEYTVSVKDSCNVTFQCASRITT